MRPLLHPHAGTYVEFADEIEPLRPICGICVDTGHLAYAGIDPAAFLAADPAAVGAVHLKDLDSGRISDGFWSSVAAGAFVPLGRGSVDFEAVLGAAARVGYDGWMVVEQDRRPGHRRPGRRPRGVQGVPGVAAMSGQRLTAAQALVRFLQVQYSERDGERRRAIPAMFGIFGHGNVCGLGQALTELGGDLPFHQPKHEQAMVHTAIGYAKASRRLADARVHGVDRPRRDEPRHGRRDGDDEPAAGPAAPRRHVREPPPGARAPAAPAPGLRGLERQRVAAVRVPVLRPDLEARAAAHRAARGDAGAARPGGDRRRHDRAPSGRAGRGVPLPGRVLRAAHVGGDAAASGARGDRRRRRARSRARSGRSSSRAAASGTPPPRARSRGSPSGAASRSPRPRRARARRRARPRSAASA